MEIIGGKLIAGFGVLEGVEIPFDMAVGEGVLGRPIPGGVGTPPGTGGYDVPPPWGGRGTGVSGTQFP